jgi:hypothetical protein
MLLNPSFTAPDQIPIKICQQGHVVLSPHGVCEWTGSTMEELAALRGAWDELPLDEYLKDGGRYRRRRHSCFVMSGGALRQAPHRAHWQPIEYNALHGGMQRWFAPMDGATLAHPAWNRMLLAFANSATQIRGEQPWYIEAHQFRIDTQGGIGRPTPEGAHRDGVDMVAVVLVAREGVKGGETRVFEAEGSAGQRFTMTEPWSLLLLDDARVIHETTPIQPSEHHGYRDTLVLTARAGGFQDR